MKRTVLIVLLILSVSYINADDPFKLITFTVNPFVRVGFASVKENTLAEPQSKISVLPLDRENITEDRRLKTDTGYLYCQVFTNSNVELRFSSTLLGRDSTPLSHENDEYHWTAYFVPAYGNPLGGNSGNEFSSDSVNQESITLLSESLTGEALNYPRLYWWDFHIELNENYEMPNETIFGELVVEVVTK